MKKIIFISIIMIISIMIVGCLDTDMTLDVDKNGNAVIYSEILISDQFFEKLSKEDIEKAKKTYDKIEKITAPGKSGYRITNNLGKLSKTNKLDDTNEFKEIIKVKEDKNLIYSIYDIQINIKDYVIENKNSKNDKLLLSTLGNSSNISFHLKTPVSLLESNATSKIDKQNGKHTYNWDYKLNNMDNIYVKVKIYDTNKIILFTILSLIILIVILFIFFKILRKRNNI